MRILLKPRVRSRRGQCRKADYAGRRGWKQFPEMKKRIGLIVFVCLVAVLALAGCSDNTRNYENRAKVIFDLQGGLYQNSEQAITYYYAFAPGTKNLISDPESLSGKSVERIGYRLAGWYTGTVAADGSVTLGEKWDFDVNKVGDDGVTLYAKWEKNIRFTYEVCYRDADGKLQELGSYEVDAGEGFDDSRNYAAKRSGFTPTGIYRDADGKIVDENYGHPGGETDTTVQVFPEYIEGEYSIVRTANDLLKSKSKNIYLMNDIDFGGKTFGGFGDYKGVIEGNGYAIRNFVLSYAKDKSAMVNDPDLGEGNLLCISLFDSLKGATVRNVSFTDFSVDISTGYSSTQQILFAPLVMKLSSSVLENVTVSMTYSVGELPKDFDSSENLFLVTDRPYFYAPEGDSSTVGVELNVTRDSE